MAHFRRITSLLILASMLMLISTTSTLAAAPTTLTCWHDIESNNGGFYDSKTITYGQQKLNTNTNFHFNAGNLAAAQLWSSKLGLTLNSTLTYSSGNIRIQGGTLNELISAGWTSFTSSYAGLTSWGTAVSTTTITFNGTNHIIYSFKLTNGNQIAIKDDNYSSTQTEITAKHEMGHALGFIGHSATGLLNANNTSTSTPTTNEIAHIKQFYAKV